MIIWYIWPNNVGGIWVGRLAQQGMVVQSDVWQVGLLPA